MKPATFLTVPTRLFLLAALALMPFWVLAQTPRNVPVPALDLQRYSGTWHQVAHLPMFFQRKCVRGTTAHYAPQADGTVQVRNACIDEAGKRIESTGVARPVPGEPGALEVRFAPDWLDWLPFTWAPYWVIALDPDYQWAMVGGPGRDYLWILSREPSLDPDRLASLVEQARVLGYPVEELIREPAPE